MKKQTQFKQMRRWGFLLIGSLVGLLVTTPANKVEGAGLGGPTHIGTFEGSTTFTTSSSNGINPGLFLEVMDEYGNLTQYESEDGIITVPNTQEGAYVTQAKLLGKTKYRDLDTDELLDEWEEGRNLRLESVQMPVLKTVGKNLFDIDTMVTKYATVENGVVIKTGNVTHTAEMLKITNLEVGKTYTLSCDYLYDGTSNGSMLVYCLTYDGGGYNSSKDNIKVSVGNTKRIKETFVAKKDTVYLIGSIWQTYISNIQIEESSAETSYEPFKSNILTVNEPVELRGIGDVRDELDLLTGEVTERIGEIVLDGSEDWSLGIGFSDNENGNFECKNINIGNRYNKVISTHFNYDSGTDDRERVRATNSNYIVIYINKTRLESPTVDGFKNWLITQKNSGNPVKVQYQLLEKSIKTVVLDSTYYFQPVMNREVRVEGVILPLVCSVTVPTEPLTFVLNPNESDDRQFVAPEFAIVNETKASIDLALKRFEQITNVMNDVLPDTHETWRDLNREQSKDIALALVPKSSEGWLNLEEGPRYVAEDSNYYLGEVKAESRVEFTFLASHGRAFFEGLNPQYRLVFMFGF